MLRTPHIFVSELRLWARVGVNPGEDATLQPLSADIAVGIDNIHEPAQSEKIFDTLDYGKIARRARRIATARHYPLVETLTTEIAKHMLRFKRATWVRVRLRKLNCLQDAASAGVELELQASSATAEVQSIALHELRSPEEIVIVGGGPAGLAAQLWCNRLGHPAILVDSALQLGGQLHLVYGKMQDLPAMQPMTGKELLNRLLHQYRQRQGRWLRAKILDISRTPSIIELNASIPAEAQDHRIVIQAKAVIIAAGIRRRALNIPGEDDFLNRGILSTAATLSGSLHRQRILVVGGGDAACENALRLAQMGASILLAHRGVGLKARLDFASQVERHPQILLHPQTHVTCFYGRERLQGAVLCTSKGQIDVSIDAALIRVGWIPNSDWIPSSWLDKLFLRTTDGQAKVPGAIGVFGAGDIIAGQFSSIPTAFGSAAVAAREAISFLETK